MYIITAKNDHRVLYMSDDLDYQTNGNYLINSGILAIPPTICDMAEVASVPDYVVPDQFLYVDGEFIVNPNYTPHEEDVLTDALSALDVLGVDTGAVENGGGA